MHSISGTLHHPTSRQPLSSPVSVLCLHGSLSRSMLRTNPGVVRARAAARLLRKRERNINPKIFAFRKTEEPYFPVCVFFSLSRKTAEVGGYFFSRLATKRATCLFRLTCSQHDLRENDVQGRGLACLCTPCFQLLHIHTWTLTS